MRYDDFRRSENIEDYRDPKKPVKNFLDACFTIAEALGLMGSRLAKDAGVDDVNKRPKDSS